MKDKLRTFSLPPIGMRQIKTVLAVMICLAIGQLIGYPKPFFACISAILTMRDTVENSISHGWTRILAACLGGLIAIVILFIDPAGLNPWFEVIVVGIGVFLTIYSTLLIGLPDAAALTASTFLVIVLGHVGDKYIFAATRIAETLAGIIIAVLINKFLNFKRLPAEPDCECVCNTKLPKVDK